MRELWLIILLLIFLFIGIIGGRIYVDSLKCHSRWADTGRQTEWGVFSRCLVESNGKLVPEDRVWYERNE